MTPAQPQANCYLIRCHKDTPKVHVQKNAGLLCAPRCGNPIVLQVSLFPCPSAELKRLPDIALTTFSLVYNTAEDVDMLPSVLQVGLAAAVSKGTSIVEPLQVKPICLLPLLHRLWNSLRFSDVREWTDSHRKPTQGAFHRKRSARGEVIRLPLVEPQVNHASAYQKGRAALVHRHGCQLMFEKAGMPSGEEFLPSICRTKAHHRAARYPFSSSNWQWHQIATNCCCVMG
eukprot:2396612-Amphidinium_carterae.1